MKRIVFPSQSKFDRVIPKTKIYSNSKAAKSLKELFISEVEQIKWSYKLASETTNLPASKNVPEIQIFTVILRSDSKKEAVLQAIDTAIPFPLIFELHFNNKYCYGVAYKRPSEADSTKWVVGDYFFSPWEDEVDETTPLPVALTLDTLYYELIKKIVPFETRDGEAIAHFIARVEDITKLQREALKVEKRMNREKQFNRRVELNRELQNLKHEIKLQSE